MTVNQVIVEIETAKSLVELPSPFEGPSPSCWSARARPSRSGTPIIRVDSSGGTIELQAPARGRLRRRSSGSPRRDRSRRPRARRRAATSEPGAAERGASGRLRIQGRPRDDATPPARSGRDALGSATDAAGAGSQPAAPVRRPSSVPAASAVPVIAKPPIRKLAKDLDVDLGDRDRRPDRSATITRDDVIRQATQASVFRNIQTPEWPSDREERIPVKGVRKAIANAMVHERVHRPARQPLRRRGRDPHHGVRQAPQELARTSPGSRYRPLLIMAKAMIWAVRRNPTVNSSWTDEEIIVRHYVNLGIAAATPRGLIVPNIKDAQDMTLLELAQALEQLTITARDGKTQPADMAGGTDHHHEHGRRSGWTPARPS